MTLLLVALTLILVISNTPWFKGKLGELFVGLMIGKTSEEPGKEQYVINNLLLETDTGKSSQIDHIVINHAGVHVIETKNYSGRIYGDDYKREWTQVLNYGKVKNHFYSPVKQNYGHICTIKQLLPDETPIQSVIVFVRGNINYIKSDYVCTPWEINQRINATRLGCLTSNEMRTIYNVLIESANSGIKSNWEHAENIHKRKEENRKNVENNVCPMCKGNLVKKKGRYGEFLACCHYPDCKFTTSIKKE